MSIDMKKLVEEVNKWNLLPKTDEELIAFEDDNGMVHIQTKNGVPRMQMPKDVYDSFKEHGVSRSG